MSRGTVRTRGSVEERLPVPPRIIARVIEVAAEAESTAADLAGVISKDPTLTTQVLRAVNSAHYGLRRRVDNVHHAVGFMGMGAVRNLVLCIGVQQLASPEGSGDFSLDLFWESSVRRAAAAACLARRLGLPQPDEFFTLGLCQDIGILVNLRRHEDFGRRYTAMMGRPAADRLAAERLFGETHDTLGAELLKAWKLPEEMTATVRLHHDLGCATSAIQGRCMIALAAESIADLLRVEDKGAALELAQEQLLALELHADLLRSIVDEVVADVAEAAHMLQLRVGPQPSHREIIALAGNALLSLSLGAPEASDGPESALTEQQRVTAELRQRNAELARQAATDDLTGLANRRVFDDTLERELAQAERQGAVLSLLLLDVDHFKRFNDTHGHQAGDLVLRRVSGVVRQSIRKSDVCARFGGEELVVVLPFTPERGARVVAERMRKAVSELAVDWDGQRLSVTISIGGITVSGGGNEWAAKDVVRSADTAMYRAKAAGRNQICWHASESP